MEALPSETVLKSLEYALDEGERPVPDDPAKARLATWSVFREPEKALTYARYVLLDEGDELVGGRTHDSLGALYWVGVQVRSLKSF